MQKNKLSVKAKVALATGLILWASAFVGIRAGLQSYSPGALALLRFIVASVCMYGFYLRLPKRNRMPLRDILQLMLLGAVAIGLYHIALNYGEMKVPSGTASFIICQSPIIITILATLFLREKLKFLAFIGMLISFSGVTFIMLSHETTFHFSVESLYILFAAIMGSVYSVMQKPFLKKYHAIEVTAYGFWGATLMLMFYLPALGHEMLVASATATLSAIYLGIFPAAVAYIAWSIALQEMPATRAANFLYFMPLISTLLGFICLHETPSWMSLVGGLLALAGLWLVNLSYHAQQRLSAKKLIL